jgi:hypothetical protein
LKKYLAGHVATLTMYKVFIVIQLITITSAVGQSYRFQLSKPDDKFDVRMDSGRVSCLFRASGKNVRPSIYRKVFLGEDLRPIDSVDLVVPDNSKLVTVQSKERYTIHVFYCSQRAQFYGKNDFFQFIVTWKSGKIHSSFVKTAVDLSPYNRAKIKVPNVIQLNFVENTGSPEMFILQFGFHNVNDGVTYSGKTAAFSVHDGRMVWVLDDIFLLDILSKEDKLIGLSSTDSEKPVYTIHFFSKENGKTLRSQELDHSQNFRIISVFATNGREVMIAGTEFPSNKGKDYEKNGHFYMSLLDFEGKLIVEQTDTTTRFSSGRMHMIGYVFDRDDNLILIGEGWKKYYGLIGFKIAGAIISQALLGTSGNVKPDQEITSLFMAKISPEDASVKDFSIFATGPWLNFSDVVTDGEYVLFKNGRDVLLFDPNDIQKAPVNFATIKFSDDLILTPYGPITITVDKKSILMQFLHSKEQK